MCVYIVYIVTCACTQLKNATGVHSHNTRFFYRFLFSFNPSKVWHWDKHSIRRIENDSIAVTLELSAVENSVINISVEPQVQVVHLVPWPQAYTAVFVSVLQYCLQCEHYSHNLRKQNIIELYYGKIMQHFLWQCAIEFNL